MQQRCIREKMGSAYSFLSKNESGLRDPWCSWPRTLTKSPFKDGVYHKINCCLEAWLIQTHSQPLYCIKILREVHLLNKAYVLLILKELAFICREVFLYYTSCWVVTRETADMPTFLGRLLLVRTLCTLYKCCNLLCFWHCKNVVVELRIFLVD